MLEEGASPDQNARPGGAVRRLLRQLRSAGPDAAETVEPGQNSRVRSREVAVTLLNGRPLSASRWERLFHP